MDVPILGWGATQQAVDTVDMSQSNFFRVHRPHRGQLREAGCPCQPPALKEALP